MFTVFVIFTAYNLFQAHMKKNRRIQLFVNVIIMTSTLAGCEKSASLFPVTGVAVDTEYATFIMGIDNAGTLVAAITPENATNKEIVWSSDNTSVALVDRKGTVTPLSEGMAKITATTLDGYYTASCTVTVISTKGKPNVVITTESAAVRFSMAGIGSAYIDWGDGTYDTYSPSAIKEFSHAYSGSLSRSIAIYAANITWLDCSNNQLTNVDVSGNTTLAYLNCLDSQLTDLDVSGCGALTQLFCSNNQLTKLDVSSSTAIWLLICSNNQLTNLNISGCSVLRAVDCANNQLPLLNASGCYLLGELNCSYNQITSLNIRGCNALTFINCSHNLLTGSLVINNNTVLKELNCSYNQWSTIDLSGCSALLTLNIRNNYLNANALHSLFSTLNNLWDRKTIYMGNNGPNYDGSGTAECDQTMLWNNGTVGWFMYD